MPKHKYDLTSVGTKKLKAHYGMRGSAIGAKTKHMKHAKQMDASKKKILSQLALEAAAACERNARFPYSMGGSYREVVTFNAEHRSACYMEANHTPAEDSYVDTPYADLPRNDRPAHAMMYYHHRSPRGALGGASSTGGSGVNKPWSAEKIRDLMKAGKFGEAMYQDIIDLTNTTHPNQGYYALALLRAAFYAKRINLMDEAALNKIATLLSAYLPVEVIAEAVQDREIAIN